jgi:hypothetical protein
MKRRTEYRNQGNLIDYILRLEYLSMPAISPRRRSRR